MTMDKTCTIHSTRKDGVDERRPVLYPVVGGLMLIRQIEKSVVCF